jgi:hypothetical protein
MPARAITWMFAALSTVEPPILELGTARLLEGDKSWSAQRMPLVEDRVRDRLGQLSRRLGDADWLDGAFSAGDLMMVSVLLRLKASGMLDEYPNLSAWPAAKCGPPTSVPSTLNWRLTPASHRPADRRFILGSKSSSEFFVQFIACIVRCLFDLHRSPVAPGTRSPNIGGTMSSAAMRVDPAVDGGVALRWPHRGPILGRKK